ncbi:putative flagellar assembly protein FliH [Paraliobacillus quinghaiensis]|uniref:Flagellar assembly protein FliH n=1 Tax=Paraliobacillus quinghaiensis TaxID=470815 RepID=A0A917TFT1_9BACI|nr:flagellar assembly protein FliH [Paraliobacillus quinghaiensis]GGM21360.1 putative flagellar assembly protein FliH [Paraliobacillus quinghaiensis]
MSNQSKVIGIKQLKFANENTGVDQEDQETLENIQKQQVQAEEELKLTRDKVDQLLADTKKRIETEQEQWKEEKARWVEEAKQQGYQDGFQLGKQESITEYKKLLEQARKIVELAEQEGEAILAQSEPKILRLGLVAASKIIHQELEKSDAYIDIVRNVLREVQEQPLVRIKSNPADYEKMQKYKDELRLIIDTKAELTFYPDEALTEGACVIETPFGKIDASVDSQLETLRHSLFDLAGEINRET